MFPILKFLFTLSLMATTNDDRVSLLCKIEEFRALRTFTVHIDLFSRPT